MLYRVVKDCGGYRVGDIVDAGDPEYAAQIEREMRGAVEKLLDTEPRIHGSDEVVGSEVAETPVVVEPVVEEKPAEASKPEAPVMELEEEVVDVPWVTPSGKRKGSK
jgi:hypothetical protein